MALSFDYEKYAPYLEDADLTEEQKREFLETLWSIMVSFVDLGFGIHPVQQVCGQEDEIGPSIADQCENMLHSKNTDKAKSKTTNGKRPAQPTTRIQS